MNLKTNSRLPVTPNDADDQRDGRNDDSRTDQENKRQNCNQS